MFTRYWLKDAAERAVRTFAQALLAMIGANAVSITDLDWPQMLSVSATAAVVAILTAVVATRVGDPESASLLDE